MPDIKFHVKAFVIGVDLIIASCVCVVLALFAFVLAFWLIEHFLFGLVIIFILVLAYVWGAEWLDERARYKWEDEDLNDYDH